MHASISAIEKNNDENGILSQIRKQEVDILTQSNPSQRISENYEMFVD